MFTSANRDLRAALIYLIVSIALALGGAVYEHFSFGVYSYYMIYAFAIPLVLGTMRFLLRYIRKTGAAAGHISDMMWHAAIITLTVGSILNGALAICGRPSSLTIVYPVAGMILIAVSLGLRRVAKRRAI